jgi:hypothetical protein
MKYDNVIRELDLPCVAYTLQARLHQKGYFRYIACQKPYLIAIQVIRQLLWAIAYIFWHDK